MEICFASNSTPPLRLLGSSSLLPAASLPERIHRRNIVRMKTIRRHILPPRVPPTASPPCLATTNQSSRRQPQLRLRPRLRRGEKTGRSGRCTRVPYAIEPPSPGCATLRPSPDPVVRRVQTPCTIVLLRITIVASAASSPLRPDDHPFRVLRIG
jgi:hypothetical protein